VHCELAGACSRADQGTPYRLSEKLGEPGAAEARQLIAEAFFRQNLIPKQIWVKDAFWHPARQPDSSNKPYIVQRKEFT
jgi:hypothetical protein